MERPISILLVEDEGVLRRLVAQFLRVSGFEVTEAVDGADGLDRFRGNGPFGLILTDLMMPRLGGVEMCREVKRARPEQPIVICSAAILPDQEGILRDLGVTDFLSKPYHPDRLVATVREATSVYGPVDLPGLPWSSGGRCASSGPVPCPL